MSWSQVAYCYRFLDLEAPLTVFVLLVLKISVLHTCYYSRQETILGGDHLMSACLGTSCWVWYYLVTAVLDWMNAAGGIPALCRRLGLASNPHGGRSLPAAVHGASLTSPGQVHLANWFILSNMKYWLVNKYSYYHSQSYDSPTFLFFIAFLSSQTCHHSHQIV